MPTSAEQLNEAIAALNAAAAAYNGKKEEIDLSVQAALAAVTSSIKSYWVHQQLGSDQNAGTEAEPLASIQEAFNRTPAGGVCQITLLADYHFSTVYTSNALAVVLIGSNLWTLTFDWFKTVESPDTINRMCGFKPNFRADYRFTNLNIELPANPVEPHAYTHMRSLIANTGTHMPALVSAKFSSVNFFHHGSDASLFGEASSFVAARFVNSTFPSGFEGRVLEGVGGAGVDPDTVARHISTNLDWI